MSSNPDIAAARQVVAAGATGQDAVRALADSGIPWNRARRAIRELQR